MTTTALHSAERRVVTIAADGLHRLRGAVRLRVVCGTVWLTTQGKPEDHMLRPGDHFTSEHHGADVLAQALFGRACFIVDRSPSWRQRMAAAFGSTTRHLAALLP